MTTPLTTTPPRYRKTLLRAGEFRLDGGSMFGVIPKVVWSRWATPDDRGRIAVQHNCLLLERLDPAPSPSAPKLILIETGTGNKLDEKNRELFALSPRSILDALHEVNCDPKSINAVVVSHLHFDHAGGLTRLTTPGETPDWSGAASSFGSPRADHAVKCTFPSATVHAQRREWLDALSNRSVMTRTYFTDHLEPIRERLVLADSIPPFSPGHILQRTDTPPIAQEFRETEILPGIWVFQVPGHTFGQQAIRFHDEHNMPVVFTPDVLPTALHIGQACSLAYDVEPYVSSVSRGWFLAEAAQRGWLLCLDHEHAHPLFHVKSNGKGWWELVKAE